MYNKIPLQSGRLHHSRFFQNYMHLQNSSKVTHNMGPRFRWRGFKSYCNTHLGISSHLLPQQYSGSDVWCHNLMANFILCLILCRSVHLCIKFLYVSTNKFTNKWRDCMQICNMFETASIRVSDITRAEFKPTSTIKLGRHSSNDPIRISRITVAFWKVLRS